MDRVSAQNIRNKILKDRGLASSKPARHKQKRLIPATIFEVSDSLKTPKMRYLELKYKEPIGKLIMSGSLSQVVSKVNGEVDTSTVSRWIKKLKLRYTPDNLPNCDDCPHFQPICNFGVCTILFDLELWSLLPIKERELH